MQKYRFGDLVKVTKDLPKCMLHFTGDCEAIVLYSDYWNVGETENDAQYGIYIKRKGRVAWYNEKLLTLIKEKQDSLLSKWLEEDK